jgi:hypothetical protein
MPSFASSIILKWTFRKWDGDMDWIDLAYTGTGGGLL